MKHHEENNKRQWEKLDNHEDRIQKSEKDLVKIKTQHEMCDTLKKAEQN